MKDTIKRMSCLLLVLCLVLTAFPFFAHAEEETEQVDFVLVLDCSGSMTNNDPTGLAAEACKKFMDLLPIENARIAVIAYGYNGSAYNYTHFKVDVDGNLVHQLSGLDGDMTAEETAALKKNITAATLKSLSVETKSPLGQGLAAGVDTLLTGGAKDGNACIVLLSDGGRSSAIQYSTSDKLTESAPKIAKEHNWPIFCIELAYGRFSQANAASDHKRLTNIAVNSGAGADAVMSVSSAADVTEALLKIFDRFMDIDDDSFSQIIKTDPSGLATLEFNVPQLASETNVIISGASVDSVELITPQGVSKKFTDSVVEGEWIATVEPGSYFAVKVLQPKEGTWTVKAHGDPNASIHVYNSSMREMNMVLIGDPATNARVTKNDKISLQSYFTYGGRPLNQSAFYEENAASIVVTSYNAAGDVKSVKEFPMTGDSSGYSCQLAVNEIPSGLFNVQVLLKHDMFRSGQKTSNALTYTSENLPLTHDESQNIDRNGYINSDLEVIDLTAVFPNPDGDPIEYVVKCVSDRNVAFDVSIDDNDYMVINTGMNVGTHQMQVEATDPDMTEPLVHDFVISVENRPLDVLDKIPEQEVWVDYYDGFIKQDPGNTVLDLDLNEYFSDPDGMPLIYGEITADVEGLVDVSWQDGKLHAEPLAEGDVVLHTTVSDGIDTVEAEIEIEVVSGKARYWQTHWFYYAMAAIALFVVLLVIIVMQLNKRVKGNWNITLTNQNGESCTYQYLNIRSATTCGKKANFTLYALLQEIMDFMEGDDQPTKEYVDYFAGGADKMELTGVYSAKGAAVRKIPSNGTVTVKVNSLSQKKPKITSGRLSFEIVKAGIDGDKLTVDMDLL